MWTMLKTKLTNDKPQRVITIQLCVYVTTLIVLCHITMVTTGQPVPRGRAENVSSFEELTSEVIPITTNCQTYAIVSERSSWDNARTYCSDLFGSSINAQLATFGSTSVFGELRVYLEDKSELPRYEGGGYWVGCNDREEEGTFTWLNGSMVNSEFWAHKQPDDGNSGQDCCLMWNRKKRNKYFLLDDQKCLNEYPFICHIDVRVATPFPVNITDLGNITFISNCENYSTNNNVIGEGRGKTKKCPADISTDDAGLIHWPTANTGQYKHRKCPYGEVGNFKASRYCSETPNGAAWETPDTSGCLPAGQTSRGNRLNNLANQTFIPPGQAKKLAEHLTNLSAEAATLDESEISLVVDVVGNILSSVLNGTDIDVAENILQTVNNMLNTNPDVLEASQQSNNVASRLIKAVEQLSKTIQLGNQSDTLVQTDDINVGVAKINSSSFGGLAFSGSSFTHGAVSKNQSSSFETPGTFIQLPDSLFDRLEKSEDDRTTKAQFISYRSTNFFKAVDKSNSTLFSAVIAASIGDMEIKQLEEPVKIALPHHGQYLGPRNISCVYWDFERNDGQGGWSNEGCSVSRNESSGNLTVCECNHLTNFALLMDVYGDSDIEEVDSTNHKALSIISYVGCCISLFALVVTIVTLVFFRKRKDRSSKILLNLCCALLMALVIFLIGSFYVDFAPITPELCTAIAVLLHYSLLAVMAWMALEAIQMYLLVVKVFQPYYKNFMIKCSLLGWGIPLVIVIITLAVDVGNYGHHNTICWLSRYAFLAAFLVPMCLVLLFNTIVFCLVIYQICGLNSKALTANQRFTITAQLRAAVSFMVVLGLTWTLAIFAIGDANLVFQYLFAIFNSLQGLFIFIFHCALSKEIQSEWRKTFCKRRRDRYKSATDTRNLCGSSASSTKYTTSSTHDTDVNIESSVASTDQQYHGNKHKHQLKEEDSHI